MYTVKFVKLDDRAIIPIQARKGDAGFDICSIENLTIKPGEYIAIKTGLKMQLPENTEAQIRPRSGLAVNHGITVLNTPGTIDEGYRGEIKVILINHGKNNFQVEEGMRIAQMVIKPTYALEFQLVQELTSSERGTAGFGSSGTLDS